MKDILDRYREFNPEELKRENKDFKFTDVAEELEKSFEIIENLRIEGVQNLMTETKREELRNFLNIYYDLLNRIKNFDPTVGNPQDERNNLANELRNNYQNFFDKTYPYITAYFATQVPGKKELTTKLKEVELALSSMNESKEESLKVLETIRETSGKAGTSAFSKVYEAQAEYHKKESDKWLIFTVLLFLAIGALLSFTFIEVIKRITENLSTSQTAQILAVKFFIISLALYALHQVIKNYNANMHLFTINKHRTNCLKTFDSFVEASDKKEIKDIILVQAAKTVFDHCDTGYLTIKDKSSLNSDILKSIDNLIKR